MSLTDELTEATGLTGIKCSLAVLLAEDPDRDEYRAVIYGNEWSAEAVSRVLRNRGHQVSAWTVRRHRRGDCAHCNGMS